MALDYKNEELPPQEAETSIFFEGKEKERNICNILLRTTGITLPGRKRGGTVVLWARRGVRLGRHQQKLGEEKVVRDEVRVGRQVHTAEVAHQQNSVEKRKVM